MGLVSEFGVAPKMTQDDYNYLFLEQASYFFERRYMNRSGVGVGGWGWGIGEGKERGWRKDRLIVIRI